MAFPLPPGYFACPPLSTIERDYLVGQAHRICTDTARNALTMAKTPPAKIVEHPATMRRALLHHGNDIVDASLYGVTGSSQIQATQDEILSFFHLSTEEKVQTYASVVGQIVLDRKTLYTLADQTRDIASPFYYAGVQWSAIACPFISKSLTLKRDTCFLEVLSSIEVDDPISGAPRKGIVRALHSVALDCCPSLRASHNVVRGALVRSGHVFLETDEIGVYDYFYTYIVADPGNVPRFVNLKIFQRIVGQMLNLDHHLAIQRLPSRIAAAQPLPRFKDARPITYCEACDTKFKLFASKTHCYLCRQVVCSACITTYRLPILNRHNMDLCTQCFCGNSGRRKFGSRRGKQLAPSCTNSSRGGSDVLSTWSSIQSARFSASSIADSEDKWTTVARPPLESSATSESITSSQVERDVTNALDTTSDHLIQLTRRHYMGFGGR
ncbi:hypothetical protein SDRG_12177 [Saprolegnia diclina VS20]|uniref:FYVE-type domain-containing protein n=1 Tax=Saprolegnia diclina (strain VS20) TaxID=1156394 RepID=T0RJQ2_SAPDV|nr:hypothetical protein SDRG_12177 [Saprolegnia diclina VS20]EQC30117.1 hypothetical protein SDRG_12177 [Saprolegnia diclina VS20]|eukprot:XP_008616460.1 hypothetical protein SDRG_12177 [Saprolegnia diclina VS20]